MPTRVAFQSLLDPWHCDKNQDYLLVYWTAVATYQNLMGIYQISVGIHRMAVGLHQMSVAVRLFTTWLLIWETTSFLLWKSIWHDYIIFLHCTSYAMSHHWNWKVVEWLKRLQWRSGPSLKLSSDNQDRNPDDFSVSTFPVMTRAVTLMTTYAGIVLYMRLANERRRYSVTSSLIGWTHISVMGIQ